jgi:hypothetical protein
LLKRLPLRLLGAFLLAGLLPSLVVKWLQKRYGQLG